MRLLSTSNPIKVICVLLATICLAIVLSVTANTHVKAAPITDFRAGNIIEDSTFYNKDAMTVAQIQSFLDSLIPSCDIWGVQPSGYGNLTNAQYAQQIKGWHAPPYVCINKYYENPNTSETSYEKGGGVFAGGISAAQIIHTAAQTYGINPQVLLVMLKKESAGPVTSDSWPLKSQYKYSMGYACPDSGPGWSANCDTSKAGFYKQMMLAAWQLKYYKDHPNDYRYHLGWNSVQYSTDPACGSKNIYIENIATLSLYIYTPYTPNDAALNNYPGTANCGAYGNRNFFAYFKEWFGNPRFAVVGYIAEGYNANTWVGSPQMNAVCGIRNGGCYQVFANGTIYWSPTTGSQVVRGGIKDKWISAGFENGRLGYPTSGEIAAPGGVRQTFQGGTIFWSGKTGSVQFSNELYAAWVAYGASGGYFGNPKTDSLCGLKNNGCYQLFQTGTLYWTAETGAQTVHGGIKDKWISAGFENGRLGYPTSGEIAAPGGGVYQLFQGGRINWTAHSGASVVYN